MITLGLTSGCSKCGLCKGDGWVSLFDGESLDGWMVKCLPKDVEKDYWKVDDGAIALEVPAGSDRLPTRALGTTAGGSFAVDPMDPEGTRTLERVFQFDLALPANTMIPAAGERVYVRFDHDAEPLAQRGYRAFRRLFLRELGV